MKIIMKYYLLLSVTVIYTVQGAGLEKPSALAASQTPLMQAAVDGNLKTLIEELEEPGVNINVQDTQCRTALFIAAQEGHANCVKVLLKNKADINLIDKDGMTPLQIAVISGDCDTINALLDACEKMDGKCKGIDQRDQKLQWTPLARAAISGKQDIIKLLLENGANPTAMITRQNNNMPVASLYKLEDKDIKELLKNKANEYADRSLAYIEALRNNKLQEAQKLFAGGIDVNAKTVKGNDDYTPLQWAVSEGHANIVKLLIDNKTQINYVNGVNFSPLQLAASCGYKDIAEMLIKFGADVNSKDLDGRSPVHWAATSGHQEILKLLINRKADVNAKNGAHATPLILATLYSVVQIMQLLIQNKADVNAKTLGGHTPLHLAAEYGFKDKVRMLIDNKADVNAPDTDGETPLQWATYRSKNKDIIDMLKKAQGPKW